MSGVGPVRHWKVASKKEGEHNDQSVAGKYGVIFGAGGSIGAAVAKEFAAEGAEVFLSGRTSSNVEDVAAQIAAAGERAHAEAVDALNDTAVNRYIDHIAKQSGRIDIVFNAVGPLVNEYGNGNNAVDLTVEQFMVPLTTIVKSQFITARAAARHMVKQHSGVIIFLTGSPARGHVEGATAIGAAFGAIETLMENLRNPSALSSRIDAFILVGLCPNAEPSTSGSWNRGTEGYPRFAPGVSALMGLI